MLPGGAGYTVVDAVNVMGTHLSELVRQHAAEMFSRQDAKLFCDRVAPENPKLVEDLVSKTALLWFSSKGDTEFVT